MAIRLFYIILIGLVTIFIQSCSEEKIESEKKEEEDVVEDEVKEVVSIFFTAIDNYNFDTAKEYATKGSYSSVKFLKKISGDFRSVYFNDIVSCEINKDKAKCVCEFGYYGEEEIERVVALEKYEDEWLIHFELGENLDNIYTYDYGYSLNDQADVVEQLTLDPILAKELGNILGDLLSSNIKIGFSSALNVASVDSLYQGGETYGYNDYRVLDFDIHTSYEFDDERLTSCFVTIDSRGTDYSMDHYFNNIYDIIEGKVGKAFNLPEEFEENPLEIVELRWFVKSYNELLVLTNKQGQIQLSITESL